MVDQLTNNDYRKWISCMTNRKDLDFTVPQIITSQYHQKGQLYETPRSVWPKLQLSSNGKVIGKGI